MASETLVKRSDKVAYYGLPGTGSTVTYTRMKGFTEFSISKNPNEYSRRYVDEDSDRTDVTGYSTSCSFAFDDFVGDAVCEDIAGIIDDETIGTGAQREIVIVDFTKKDTDGTYAAIKRTMSIIADSEGDSTDAYTYSGNLRSAGKTIKGKATAADGRESLTVTFAENTSE